MDIYRKKKAQSIVASPYQNVNQNEFDNLITIGFRRSGNHVYKPHCHNCEACTPIRLDVYRFKRNRTQERCFKKNNLHVYVISTINKTNIKELTNEIYEFLKYENRIKEI